MSASEVSVSGRTPISFLNIFKAVQGYFDVIVDQPIRKQDWGHVTSEMESSGGDWLTAQELKITSGENKNPSFLLVENLTVSCQSFESAQSQHSLYELTNN